MWFFKKQDDKTDEQLLTSYKQSGNKEFFAQLFSKHVKIVYGTCLFYLQDKDDAQDATMVLFEKISETINSQTILNFKGWLSFVVRNHCISIIRKNKTYQKNIKIYYEFEYQDPNQKTEETLSEITDDVMLHNLKNCLPKLKEQQRVCISLFYLQNKSYQAIATITNYSINEVKSYIQNGKRNLKLMILEQPLI